MAAPPAGRAVRRPVRQAYRDSNEPNLIFGIRYRYLATRYLTKVFNRLGTDFSIVRVGGGHCGELTYQAGKFLSWYLNSLAIYQNWQIASLRLAGFPGRVAVLYPSWGMRAGDFERAVATNLAGTSSPEINGEVQRGYDARRQIAALKDPNVVVYGTWAENIDTMSYLAGLASAKGLPTMGETSHVCTPAQLPEVLRQNQAHGVEAVYVVRLPAADVVSSSRYLAASTA